MSLPRLSLVVAGLIFLGLGLYLFYAPETVARLTGSAKPTALLLNEIRAMYGGLQLGLGLYFLVAASRGRWIRSALGAQVAVFSGIAIGRVAGMVVGHQYSRILLALAVLELLGALLGAAALHRARALMALNYSRRL